VGKINATRVILGGLLAGLVINVGEALLSGLLLAERLEQAYRQLGLAAPGGAASVILGITGFLIGIALIWLYAAIRPRFGPGPVTAILAGSVTWLLVILFPALIGAAMGVFPAGLFMLGSVWALFEYILAGLAGGWAYRET
jgi:hypothetical protein